MKKRYLLSILLLLLGLALGLIAFRFFTRPQLGGPAPAEMVKTLLEFDQNGDGQLRTDEVPERMQGLFTRGDANQDGVLTQDELRKLAEADAAAAQQRVRERRR